ncbi:Protein tyrosine kinase Protein kinase domain [Trypanosoma vivax]|uniref:Mitogen-activated protein kinase n=1 Tax=Trypanosoma vivax (strain Y486) TaxID=1055687 RepID=G0U4Y6_TRYVY|nr:putative mitogen-activated protein kinase [Trypanosoma vivax]KAH8610931.1 Protein tyrosine kinase Protein kinase domain [Trypanosoma vivax]CCC52501.1 putative mitogen-activated protein kinase [Trypanosoma vivax Y486]
MEQPHELQTSTGSRRLYLVQGQPFEVSKHFKLIKHIGSGSYGSVCSALDENSGERVAIKKIPRVFSDLKEGKRILREMDILTTLRHCNLIRLREFIRPENKDAFSDIYIVMDLYDTDLHRIIRSRQNLTNEHYQYLMIQAFRGLHYLHTAKVMHRDLKPSNLLVNADCALAICDFGLARDEQWTPTTALTEYVVTRWYRPPELLGMGSYQYTNAVDVWSMGLIFAELMVGKTLLPGPDYIRQLIMIVHLLGTPTMEDMEFLSEEARNFLLAQPPQTSRPFSEFFPMATPEASDLLSKLLVFHPAKRLTAKEVIEHPYFAKFRDPKAEAVAQEPYVWRHSGELTLKELRDEMWRTIVENSPE